MDNVAGARLLGEIWEQGQNVNDNFEMDGDEEEDRDVDGAMDGGVALNPDDDCGGSKRRSSECDLLLFLYCEEALECAPSHPVLRPGVVVSIGLDKNTKLSAVFNRYVEFCNETGDSRISVKDLEFVHCQLLNANDTAEASALMKNDRILARKIRANEREADEARKRLQRDADRTFFQQLRHLMPDLGGSKTADVMLDCQGKVTDESGRNQQVLRTTVRAHSTVVAKRCPWLGDIIKRAREKELKESMAEENATPGDDEYEGQQQVRRVESDGKSAAEMDDDDGIVLSFQPKVKRADVSAAAQIENDDDELPFDEPKTIEDQHRAPSPVMAAQQPQSSGKNLLWVKLPNHSPEAVKLLLEYCYSNRVNALGHEAFVQACKTKPHKHQGPVPPYHGTSGSRRWPNGGQPTVSLSVALAGINLAEEARIPRLSLMCEVAASQLLFTSNVVEALSICTAQKRISGNDLPRLRKAAMDIVLRSGARGVVELGRTPGFKKALEERRDVIVPTLLHGTMEAVTTYEKSRGIKRDRSDICCQQFDDVDREDSVKRERERRKHRHERYEQDPSRRPDPAFEVDDFYEPPLAGWSNNEPSKRSLKRMAHHLETITSRRGVTTRSHAAGLYGGTRRSSGRRRSNQG
mmetsp:Transcript_8996/g.14441  ORF Transcript_8996/g.14441 Transcript_8996/m.14441 type:complete len:636 (+) Transcript_8996:181-2088(+)